MSRLLVGRTGVGKEAPWRVKVLPYRTGFQLRYSNAGLISCKGAPLQLSGVPTKAVLSQGQPTNSRKPAKTQVGKRFADSGDRLHYFIKKKIRTLRSESLQVVMPTREFAALLLLGAPFVAIAVLWFFWVRGVPQKNRVDSAKRAAALALPPSEPLTVYMGRGGVEHLVVSVGPAFALRAVVLGILAFWVVGYPLSAKALFGIGALGWGASCAGLWKYARRKNRQPVLYLSSEGLQALTGTRVLWRDVESVEGHQKSFGTGIHRAVQHTLTFTLRPGAKPRFQREGGMLIRGMLSLKTGKDGRATLTLNVNSVEDWATLDVLRELVQMRIDAGRSAGRVPA